MLPALRLVPRCTRQMASAPQRFLRLQLPEAAHLADDVHLVMDSAGQPTMFSQSSKWDCSTASHSEMSLPFSRSP